MDTQRKITFLNQPFLENLEQTSADATFIGIGLNSSYSFRGLEQAPDSIRAFSQRYSNGDGSAQPIKIYNPDRTDGRNYPLMGITIEDAGNLDLTREPEETISSEIKKMIRAQGFPIISGGDHYITYPILKSYNQEITVIQIDAHGDFLPVDCGCELHASVMTYVSNLPNVRRIIHVGLRGNLNTGEGLEESLRRGNKIVTCSQLLNSGPESVLDLLLPNEATYVSFDADALDPSIAPGVGMAEPGGLSYMPAKNLLCAIAEKTDVKGIDFNEFNPALDWNNLTAGHLTNLMIEFISARFAYKLVSELR